MCAPLYFFLIFYCGATALGNVFHFLPPYLTNAEEDKQSYDARGLWREPRLSRVRRTPLLLALQSMGLWVCGVWVSSHLSIPWAGLLLLLLPGSSPP